MAKVGLRELRQQASDIVRRAEAGEMVIVTVSGRDAAQLTAIRATTWRQWPDVVDIFDGPVDVTWRTDRDLLDQAPTDPFER